MTAFGNEEKVSTSKSIMEHAVLGLVIVLSAYAISRFVFGALTTGIGSPSPTAAPTRTAGESCGTNSVWNDSDNCIPECSYQFPEAAGCLDINNSDCSEPFRPGLCPGAANIQCCAGQEVEIIIDN
jgi:hypothetical protein